MTRSSTRWGVVCASAMLLIVAAYPAAASQKVHIPPRGRTFATLQRVSGLGPVAFSDGLPGMNRLRLTNLGDTDATALVNGTRLSVPTGAIVESERFTGTVTVRSMDELLVNSRTSDVSMKDALEATHDAQFASTDLRHPEIASLTVATQTCGTTTPVSTASVACQNGTSAAMVEAIPGATYEWTATNAQIISGIGTNMVTLAFGQVANAAVSVVVRTPDGCTLNGSATIAVRTPYTFTSFDLSSASPRVGEPLTVSWSYSTPEPPKTQKLM